MSASNQRHRRADAACHAIVRSGSSDPWHQPDFPSSSQKSRSLSDQPAELEGSGASHTYQTAACKVSKTPHKQGRVCVGLMQNTRYPSREPTIHGWFAQTFSASSCQRRIGSMCSIDGGRNGLIGIFLISASANIGPSSVSISIIH